MYLGAIQREQLVGSGQSLSTLLPPCVTIGGQRSCPEIAEVQIRFHFPSIFVSRQSDRPVEHGDVEQPSCHPEHAYNLQSVPL